MISLSAAILVATCTATFGLHSSSSTTSSYSYFAFASALRSLTASSAELRPPMPLTETPPVNGPMKPTFTLSLALAAAVPSASTAAINPVAIMLPVLIISPSPFLDFRRYCAATLWPPPMLARPKIESKLTKLFSLVHGDDSTRQCIAVASQNGLPLHSRLGVKSMAQVTYLSRIALGASVALIVGTAAYAQTPPPAPDPAASAPAATAPAAPAPAATAPAAA